MGSESERPPRDASRDARWWVYVLVSPSTERTYVGVTTDPERRIAEHNGLRAGGARRTRAGRPWELGVLHGPFLDRGEAQAIEHRVRRRRGAARLASSLPDE